MKYYKTISVSVALIVLGILATIPAGIVYGGYITTDFGLVSGGTISVDASDPYSSRQRQTSELDNLLKQHTLMATDMKTELYRGREDSRLNESLDENTDRIKKVVQSAYGIDVGNSFAPQWAMYMMEYRSYTLAVRSGNIAGMNSSKDHLRRIAFNAGRAFSDKIPDMDGSAVERMMEEHINGMLSVIDSVSQGNEAARSEITGQAYYHTKALSEAIMSKAP